MAGSASSGSVRLRALRSSNPHIIRAAGRRFSVDSALTPPACGMVEITPRMPFGSLTQRPLYALIRRRYASTIPRVVIRFDRIAC